MKEDARKLWTERINNYRSSGLTAVRWAEENNLSVHKLRYYINKFNKEKKQQADQESKEAQWVSIVPKKPISNHENANPLKVAIGKATIEIGTGFNEDIFESVVRILSKC